MKATTFIYDIEVWPNLFLVGYKRVDEDEFNVLQIGLGHNQMDEIVELFQTKKAWFVGYNNHQFDNLVIQQIITKRDIYARHKLYSSICTDLFKRAQTLIEGKPRYQRTSFKSFDLMRIGGIRKSLKMVAINLKWPLIQELPYPFDEPISEDQYAEVVKYNRNDVEMTEALYLKLRDEINMRARLSTRYKLNLMNESDSGMANRLLEKFYGERTQQTAYWFKNQRTPRPFIQMKSVVHPGISFRTKSMERFLHDLRQIELTDGSKPFKHRVRLGDSVYDLAKGGLHSANQPQIYTASDEYLLIDVDAGSYYPRIMTSLGIKPAHLSDEFNPLLEDLTNDRLKAKRANDVVEAYGLKISVNSTFGKTGYEHHWLYDPLAMYRVTVNGQLMLLMLIEKLELAGMDVFYANTDGITVRVHQNQLAQFDEICQAWEARTHHTLENSRFERCIIRDVNNFLIVKEGGGVKMKGAFDIHQWNNPAKGYKCPVVPLAVYRHFVDGTPVEETIRNHEDLFDFCLAQKPDKSFEVYFDEYNPSMKTIVRHKLQKANRYYVSNAGGSIKKTKGEKEISMIADETVVLLNDYDANHAYPAPKYEWYIREAMKMIQPFQTKQIDMFHKSTSVDTQML